LAQAAAEGEAPPTAACDTKNNELSEISVNYYFR
jgi:hypothetical protein